MSLVLLVSLVQGELTLGLQQPLHLQLAQEPLQLGPLPAPIQPLRRIKRQDCAQVRTKFLDFTNMFPLPRCMLTMVPASLGEKDPGNKMIHEVLTNAHLGSHSREQAPKNTIK